MPLVHAGKALRIELTEGQWQAEEISDDTVRRYLLGSGLAAKLFYEEMDPTVGPLEPESPLYVFNGLLSGTFAPTGCRSSWCGRSPIGVWARTRLGNSPSPAAANAAPVRKKSRRVTFCIIRSSRVVRRRG